MSSWAWWSLAELGGGAVLAVWNVWQHRGRSPAARAWTHDWMGSFKWRSVLVLRPLLAVALISVGLFPVAEVFPPLGLPCVTAFGISLALLVVYLLPLPVPRWTMPQWCRDELDRQAAGAAPPGHRRRHGRRS